MFVATFLLPVFSSGYAFGCFALTSALWITSGPCMPAVPQKVILTQAIFGTRALRQNLKCGCSCCLGGLLGRELVRHGGLELMM